MRPRCSLANRTGMPDRRHRSGTSTKFLNLLQCHQHQYHEPGNDNSTACHTHHSPMGLPRGRKRRRAASRRISHSTLTRATAFRTSSYVSRAKYERGRRTPSLDAHRQHRQHRQKASDDQRRGAHVQANEVIQSAVARVNVGRLIRREAAQRLFLPRGNLIVECCV